MAKLKISTIADDKPVKLTIQLPAPVFHDLTLYAEALQRDTHQDLEIAKLIAPMLEKFMASDKEFRKMKRIAASPPLAGVREKQTDSSPKPQPAGLASEGKPG